MWVDLVVCRTDSALKFGWFFFTYLVSFPFGLVNNFDGFDTSKGGSESKINAGNMNAVSHSVLCVCGGGSSNYLQGKIVDVSIKLVSKSHKKKEVESYVVVFCRGILPAIDVLSGNILVGVS